MLNIDIKKKIEEHNDISRQINELKELQNNGISTELVALFKSCLSYYASIIEKEELNAYVFEYIKNLMPKPTYTGTYKYREYTQFISKISGLIEDLLSEYISFYIDREKNTLFDVRYIYKGDKNEFAILKNNELYYLRGDNKTVDKTLYKTDKNICIDMKWREVSIYDLIERFLHEKINIFELCETVCKNIYDQIIEEIEIIITNIPSVILTNQQYSIKISINDGFRTKEFDDFDMPIKLLTMIKIGIGVIISK